MRNGSIWIAGTILAVLGTVGVLSSINAQDDDPAVKAMKEAVDKIAATLQKGDKEGATKQAATLAKKMEELAEAMDLLKPRAKGGYGVGAKPKAISPDHIDQMLQKVGRDVPAAAFLNKESAALEQMGYRVAAIGLVASARPPTKLLAKQNLKDWGTWSKEMVEGGLAVAAAAKAKGAQDVKTTANKLNNTCTSCHVMFR